MKVPHQFIKRDLQTLPEKIIYLNEGAIKNELKESVRNNVETLHGSERVAIMDLIDFFDGFRMSFL